MADVPKMTDEQRRQALERAGEARLRRAEILGEVRRGERTVADVLADAAEPVVARTRVSALIRACPGFGPARTEKLMDELGIAPHKRVGGLGPVQARALRERFGGERGAV